VEPTKSSEKFTTAKIANIFIKVINWAKKYDLKIVAYLILILLEDTLEEITA